MQLRDFLQILRTRWKIVVASVILVVAVAGAVTWSTTPTYTADAQVYLSARGPSDDDEQQYGVYALTSTDLNTYVAVMGSPSVLEPLREQLGLPPDTPIDTSAVVDEKASVLNISARSSDPQLAADIANAVGPQLAAVADEFSPLLRASRQTVSATTIKPAVAPSTPTAPDVRRNLALALLTGLALGIGLAFVRHAVDTKVRSDRDVKAMNESPIIGHVPFNKALTPALSLALESEPHGGYAESIRRLRTNLMFVDVTTGRHAFVITSAMPGDGKTLTTVNLAMAMADAGTRVLLIDADLRNPSVASTIGLEGAVGLTTVLLGSVAPEDVIQQWRDTSLFVLPAGQIPPNPSELLGSGPMEALFDKLLNDFDFVLVDSPPVVPVIDAVILDRYTDGLLMVVGMDRTRKRDLASAIKSLETVQVKISGFVLNLLPARSSDVYHYGYGGSSGAASKKGGASAKTPKRVK